MKGHAYEQKGVEVIEHIDGDRSRRVGTFHNTSEAEIITSELRDAWECGSLHGIGITPIIVGAVSQGYVVVSAIKVSRREYVVVACNPGRRERQYATMALLIQSDGSMIFTESHTDIITHQSAALDMIERAGYGKQE